MHRRRGFTLVELITVIGLIAVLIALLLPALTMARQAANAVACQSNLRQIHQASISFSLEHQGFLQICGSVNGLDAATPALLDDSAEKRYLWYDDAGERRVAPLQAALAPYLGNRNVRLDSAANLAADVSKGNVLKVFTCPAQKEALPSIMIGSYDLGWTEPLVPSSYAYNEDLLGFESVPRRLRGKLGKVRSSAEMVLLTDGVPRTEGNQPFPAWFSTFDGRCTLAEIFTNNDGQGGCGMPSQFDLFRHPRLRMNVLFVDGHVEALVINEKDLGRGVLIAE